MMPEKDSMASSPLNQSMSGATSVGSTPSKSNRCTPQKVHLDALANSPSSINTSSEFVDASMGSKQNGGMNSRCKAEDYHFIRPEDCPVFSPTLEEFKNPLTYIAKIRPIAEKYGICKIKPPASWQPPFTVDVDKLKFTPRVQRLNELEAKTRVKLNFLDQIAKFWELQGSSLKIPMVERKALDLYSLHHIVCEEGGLEATTNNRKWSRVATRMGYPAGKGVGTILKGHYERILYPFDVFTSGKVVDTVKKFESNSDKDDRDDHDYKPHGILTRQQVTPPKENPHARRSKRFMTTTPVQASDLECDVKSESESNSVPSPVKTDVVIKQEPIDTVEVNKTKKVPTNTDPLAKYICHICNRGDIEEAMLLCDGCDDSYHTFCLIPPLADIPKGDWRCPKCVVEEVSKPVEAFGFEQAQREYTLQQFGEMADQFKADYFNMPVHMVPTELVEREFWRVVSSIDEDVTVEYGADLHTMDHGSGFPTRNSLNLLSADLEYADSSWNLNNLPVLEESILGHINADISGMKVPWMYVGMCFATFCWHNEDHWSYSINYLHWGEPKTWYGVPGTKAELFEETMKKAAPELFQSQPDLLHQLVTIMNPNILSQNGVPVYRTDQGPGEFVITFPRAYHAGFNQGYNFAEAVNFAPADWMKMGRECVNHYSMLRRFCVFSHDELVCKMALTPEKLNFGIATACYLDMAEMVDSEKKMRKSLLEWGVTKAERKSFELIPDDERQCEVCKTTCFLSAVTCQCTQTLVCLRHYTGLCKCPPVKHTLQYRYTLDELPVMLKKLKVKAESFEKWLSKVRNALDPNKSREERVPLEELQGLAHEAESKKFPASIILERLQTAVLEAEKCVTVIQQLDLGKSRNTDSESEPRLARYKLTLAELDLFVQEIDNLWCHIKEGAYVRDLQRRGKEFVTQSDNILAKPLSDLRVNDVNDLVQQGSRLCIKLPQMAMLRDRLKQVKWYRAVKDLREANESTDEPKKRCTYRTIKQLIEDCYKLTRHAEIEKELSFLLEVALEVDEWDKLVKRVFDPETRNIDIVNIERLLTVAEKLFCELPAQQALQDGLIQAKEWLATVEALQTNDNYPYLDALEQCASRGRKIPIQLEEIRRIDEHLNRARVWKERAAKTFLRTNDTIDDLMKVLSPKNVMREEQFNISQLVTAYKMAEETELSEMRALRQLNMGKDPTLDKYCHCEREFYGVMLQCQLCRDWFHRDCVNTDVTCLEDSGTTKKYIETQLKSLGQWIKKQKQPENGTLPSQVNSQIPKSIHVRFLCMECQRTRRPKLETILSLLVALQRLPIRIPEGEALQCLTERAMSWQDRVKQALQRPEIRKALAQLASKKRKSDTPLSLLENDDNTTDGSLDGSKGENAFILSTSGTDQPISFTPTIQLTDADKNHIDELMMEGDLLEVTMNEKHQLWRLVLAAQPTLANLVHIYTLHPTIPIVTADRKENTNSMANSNTVGSKIVSKKPQLVNNKIQRKKRKQRPENGTTVNVTPKKDGVANEKRNATALNTTPGKTKSSLNRSQSGNRATDSPLQKRRKRGANMAGSNALNSTKPTGAEEGKSEFNINRSSIIERKQKQHLQAQLAAARGSPNSKTTKLNTSGDTSSTSDDDEECSADKCLGPEGQEVDWIQCDSCNKWFHMLCVGVDKTKFADEEDYACRLCEDKRVVKIPTTKSSVNNEVATSNDGNGIDIVNNGSSKEQSTIATRTTRSKNSSNGT